MRDECCRLQAEQAPAVTEPAYEDLCPGWDNSVPCEDTRCTERPIGSIQGGKCEPAPVADNLDGLFVKDEPLPFLAEELLCGQGENACAPGCCKTSAQDRPEDVPLTPEQQAFSNAIGLCVQALRNGNDLIAIPAGLDAARVQVAIGALTGKETVLGEAARIISGARRGAYGTAEKNFDRIAALWNAYLGGKPNGPLPITAQDTALLVILIKVARLIETPRHRDSVVDIAGYAGCIETLWDDQDASLAKLADEL